MLDWASVERKNKRNMVNSEDLAMRYESIIRSCFGCKRNEHNADTDIFRHLCDDYYSLLHADKESPAYLEIEEKYNESAKLVTSSLKEAMLKIGREDLANKLSALTKDCPLYVITFIMGEISIELQERQQ